MTENKEPLDTARKFGGIPIDGLAGLLFGDFKPCVVYNPALRVTQMVLEDVPTVWHPWRGTAGLGQAADLGYDGGGTLVGLQIWDVESTRKSLALCFSHRASFYLLPCFKSPTVSIEYCAVILTCAMDLVFDHHS